MIKRSRKSRQRRTEQKKRQEQILSVQEEVESAAAEKKIDDYYQLLKERDVVFFLSDRVQTVLGEDFVLRFWLENSGRVGGQIGSENPVDLLEKINYIENNPTVVIADEAYEHVGDVNRLHREFVGSDEDCLLVIAPTHVLHNEINNNPVARLQYLYSLACAAQFFLLVSDLIFENKEQESVMKKVGWFNFVGSLENEVLDLEREDAAGFGIPEEFEESYWEESLIDWWIDQLIDAREELEVA